MPHRTIRVALVEDVPLFRKLLGEIIEESSDLELVATAGTINQARTIIPGASPDVLLLDLNLPDGHGFDLGIALRREFAQLRIVILSDHVRPEVLDLLPEGEVPWWSYILKSGISSPQDLIEVIKASRPRIDDAVKRVQGKGDVALHMLSDRQRQILGLVASGYSNAAIAEELFIQTKSVEFHLTQIYTLLRLTDDGTRNVRVQAAVRFKNDEANGDISKYRLRSRED